MGGQGTNFPSCPSLDNSGKTPLNQYFKKKERKGKERKVRELKTEIKKTSLEKHDRSLFKRKQSPSGRVTSHKHSEWTVGAHYRTAWTPERFISFIRNAEAVKTDVNTYIDTPKHTKILLFQTTKNRTVQLFSCYDFTRKQTRS